MKIFLQAWYTRFGAITCLPPSYLSQKSGTRGRTSGGILPTLESTVYFTDQTERRRSIVPRSRASTQNTVHLIHHPSCIYSIRWFHLTLGHPGGGSAHSHSTLEQDVVLLGRHTFRQKRLPAALSWLRMGGGVPWSITQERKTFQPSDTESRLMIRSRLGLPYRFELRARSPQWPCSRKGI